MTADIHEMPDEPSLETGTVVADTAWDWLKETLADLGDDGVMASAWR
ncbi:hypothetical protein [Gulosibacter macacae]|nr:hypothetical protein [Gulosibacter macacae]